LKQHIRPWTTQHREKVLQKKIQKETTEDLGDKEELQGHESFFTWQVEELRVGRGGNIERREFKV